MVKFLGNVIEEVWYNDLKDSDTLYTKVTALKIISFLNANSRKLHALNMISLVLICTNIIRKQMGSPSVSSCWRMPRKRRSGLACPLPKLNSS